MPANEIKRWTKSLLSRLEQCGQRQLLLVQGPRTWCEERLGDFRELDPSLQLLSNRDELENAVPYNKAEACFGTEARLVVIDLFEGFNPDILCIGGGLVQAGGILILMSPEGEWDISRDRYARWQDGGASPRAYFVESFFERLRADPQIGIVLQPRQVPALPADLPVLKATRIERGCTREQADLLQRIEQWAARANSGCVLVSADRGRGKSTCLGMLAARLQNRCRILVTSASRRSAAVLLARAPNLEFVAPDHLLRDFPAADLLLVDEAAMIPLPMLQQLSRLYPKLVMATTSGGYEGTGQGFMLRFAADLEKRGLVHYRLRAPVRWCAGDLLEDWLGRSLLLQQDKKGAASVDSPLAQCRIEVLAHPGEPRFWPQLQQVYDLLSSAHYRTRPSDLRMLMENPDLVLIVAWQQDQVVGVALLNREGGFDESLCTEVFFGRRRPRGHLLAQMLTAQAGLKHFATYRGLRVHRIAVASGYRRQGLGSRLLEYCFSHGRDQGFDYVGASFALDAEIAGFWQQAGFVLAHVSYAQGKSSGDHSIAVLRPIAIGLNSDIERLQQRMLRQLPIWLTQFLQLLEAEQVVALLRFSGYRAELDQMEREEIEAFALGNRGFELSFASLQKFVMNGIAQDWRIPDRLLIEKAVQNRAWRLLEREAGDEGRRQLQQRLRELVAALVKD